MGKLKLIEDTNIKSDGFVLFSEGKDWIRPTGIYVPSSVIASNPNEITVLLWFHGYYVKDVRYLFYQEATNLLSAVITAKKDVILVAPELGWYQTKTNTSYNSGALGGGIKTEKYLDQVLDAYTDWFYDTFVAGDIDMIGGKRIRFQLGKLYAAGHSGGGVGIVNSVAALGGYRDRLRECWGFDCLYGSGQWWYEWAKGQKGIPLYFYYGQGTKPGFKGDVLGFWKRVYGTPKSPLSAAARMQSVHLAPALPGTEMDLVAFQSTQDILARAKAGNRYEEVRRKVDPLLDDPDKYWSTIIKEGLKDHYPVVADLLGPRIKQSIA